MMNSRIAARWLGVVLGGATLLSGCNLTDPAGRAEEIARKRHNAADPLEVLSHDERERFVAENADGSMEIVWEPSEYDLAMQQFLDDQAAGIPSPMPNPLDFPDVVVNPAPPPDPSTIVEPPHTPPAPSGG